MGRVYTVEFENVSITNAAGDQDLFYIAPADDKPIRILGFTLDQISDVGDAQEEILRYRIIRGHTTASSGGSAPTPVPLNPSDAAAGFTARTNDTTIASSGTTVNLHSGAWNIRSGERLFFPDKMQPVANQGNTSIVLRLMAGPADDLTMSGTLYVEED